MFLQPIKSNSEDAVAKHTGSLGGREDDEDLETLEAPSPRHEVGGLKLTISLRT